ncbi:MAG: hypothetical protein LBL34_03300, partial [Clostridiales bacterium]|nr:hypothetical protein [Clostridiales bacterium]
MENVIVLERERGQNAKNPVWALILSSFFNRKILSMAMIVVMLFQVFSAGGFKSIGGSPAIAKATETVVIDVSAVTASGTGYTYSSPVINLMGGYDYVLTGSATGTKRINVPVDVTVDITLKSLIIDNVSSNTPSFIILGKVDLHLIGRSVLKGGSSAGYAGLNVVLGAELTIDGEGILEATGGSNGAGIGGSNAAYGKITIDGGTIIATGGAYAAGIGCANTAAGTAGSVTINGGTVIANGTTSGAGIGGGNSGSNNNGGSGGTITINGGTVTATATGSGAGIGGGGGYGSSGNRVGGANDVIIINNGIITAKSTENGAGIGGGGGGGASGAGGNGGIITINGGTVTANAVNQAAGIGGGGGLSVSYAGGQAGTLTITGGTVNAASVANGPGIGAGGTQNVLGTIIIKGGMVTATGGTGGTSGIGGGYSYPTTVGPIFDGGSIKMSPLGMVPKNSGGTNLYLTTYTVSSGNEFLGISSGTSGGSITFVDDPNPNPSSYANKYGIHDVATDRDGKLYFWLPNGTPNVSLVAATNTYTVTYTTTTTNTGVATLAGTYVRAVNVEGTNSTDAEYVTWEGDTLKFLQDGEYTL